MVSRERVLERRRRRRRRRLSARQRLQQRAHAAALVRTHSLAGAPHRAYSPAPAPGATAAGAGSGGCSMLVSPPCNCTPPRQTVPVCIQYHTYLSTRASVHEWIGKCCKAEVLIKGLWHVVGPSNTIIVSLASRRRRLKRAVGFDLSSPLLTGLEQTATLKPAWWCNI